MHLADSPKVVHVFSKYLDEPWARDIIDHLPVDAKFVVGLSISTNQPVVEGQRLIRHGLENIRRTAIDGNLVHRLQYAVSKRLKGDEIDRLFKPLASEKVEVMHAHFADTAYEFMPLAKRLKIPLVFSFYGWDYAKLLNDKPEYINHYKELFEYSSAIIAEGPYGAEIISSLGCPKEKIEVVPLGLPTTAFAKTNESAVRHSIVQAAAFTEKKGQLYSLKAFELIADDFPNARLTFIAPQRNSVYEKKVRDLCQSSTFSDRILIRDGVPYEILPAALSEHSIFCQPSVTAKDFDCEGGAPVTILMAQAQGLAVVGSSHCDIPFVTCPLGWNVLADEHNVNQLADSLRNGLLRSSDQTKKELLEVTDWVREHFSITLTSLALQRLYKKIEPIH